MRGRLLTIPAIGRAAGFALVAAAIVAAAMHFHREGVSPPLMGSATPTAVTPLAAALSRCQGLGVAAEADAACQAAWTANRRRFFGDQPATKER